MKPTKHIPAPPVPKFANGQKVYSLTAANRKFVFKPETVYSAEIFPSNPNSPAPKRVVYTLNDKPMGLVFSEGKLYTQDEAMDICKEKPGLYKIENERSRK